MRQKIQKSSTYILIGVIGAAALSLIERPAQALILHPGGEPNLASWMDRPRDDVVGRWGNNASCIAVSPNCIITTRHQGGNINTPVEISGSTYSIAQIWDHNTADLRVAELHNANLAYFAGIYKATNEVRKNIVIGGYGDGRGKLLQKQGITYGYQWDNSSNTTLRFGTNRIEYVKNDNNLADLISEVVIADFDGLGEGRSTIYESTAVDHDSGGGWFIKVGDTWKVAGLSRTLQLHYEKGHEGDPNHAIHEQSWFRDSNDPNLFSPDYFDAVRLSSYADWIIQTIPEYVPGDLTDDGWVDITDFAVFGQFWLNTECAYPDWCAGADFEPDGDVDWTDLAFLLNIWLGN